MNAAVLPSQLTLAARRCGSELTQILIWDKPLGSAIGRR
jgi:hypothetical protein